MQTNLILKQATRMVVIVALMSAGTAAVNGDTIYWDKPANAGSNWATVANWSTASNATTPDPVAVPGSADLAVFSITVAGGSGTNVNFGNGAVQSALGLLMTASTTTSFRGGDAGNPLASSTLNLGASGILKTGTGGASIGSATAGSNITVNLVADQTWENNSTGGLRVDGPVTVPADITNTARVLTIGGTNTATLNSFTGSAGLLSDGSGSGNTLAVVKTGTGRWTLASTTVAGLGQHTFSGGLTISEGTLSVNGESSTGGVVSGPLGRGVLTMNGGTLLGSRTTVAATGTTNTLANNVNLNAVAGNMFSVVNGTDVGATSTMTLSGILSGAGGFAKTGSGVLVLSNANTYSGNTSVDEGTLSLMSAFLADGADVLVGNGAILDLNFSGTDIVKSLYLGGVLQAPGLYGATGLGAAFFSGTGLLKVLSQFHPGDFDTDGDVDGADFVAWQTNFPTATGATLSQGDADADGDVDGADFVVWQTNFPFTPGPGASPIPEPSSIILAVMMSVTLGLFRHKYQDKRMI